MCKRLSKGYIGNILGMVLSVQFEEPGHDEKDVQLTKRQFGHTNAITVPNIINKAKGMKVTF